MKQFSFEKAKEEAEEIRQLTGKKGTKEDFDIAENLIEAENAKDPKKIAEAYYEGRVFVMPPDMDKHVMIALNTNDSHEYELFNMAAGKVTKKYHGFHQVGAGEREDFSAWELWDIPKDVDPYQIVREVEEEMRELKKLGF
mgnify:CR=1 FL=1